MTNSPLLLLFREHTAMVQVSAGHLHEAELHLHECRCGVTSIRAPCLRCLQNDLQATFLSFASYGTRQPESQLEGSKFKKLCTDCGLLDK